MEHPQAPTTAATAKPATPQPTAPKEPYDPIFGLQEKVASLLAPVFKTEDTDERFAYQIARRSLEAYEPETRVDFVNVGRTIAFSLAAMALLAEAAAPDMHLDDKMRVLTLANVLNRSADQSERSMMDRRRYQRAYPALPAHVPADPAPEPPTPEHPKPGHPTPEPNDGTEAASTNDATASQPEINVETPPIQIPAIHYVYRANTPPAHMTQAVNQNSPAPRPM